MCGIIGYAGNEDSVDILLDGLRKLEYRGYDSAGIAVCGESGVSIVKARGRLQALQDKIDAGERPVGTCGIGHTRWATHGEPSDVNAHPHHCGHVTLVHNGIIENYMQLKAERVAEGVTFVSETDTEVAAATLNHYYTGDPIAAIAKTAEAVEGSYALGILFDDQPDTIYAVRHDSPLVIGLSDKANYIASDMTVLLQHTKKYLLPEPGEIAVVRKDGVEMYDMDGERIHKDVMTADWDIGTAEKDGYPHFMLKEIHEEPDAVRRCISPRIRAGQIQLGIPGLPDDVLAKTERIHIVACGTAMHAGLVGRYAIESLARVPVEVDIASEFRYRNPVLGKNDLVILISQSGETADTLAALRLAKQREIRTLAIVNVPGSSIAREADDVLYTWAGPEIAVASTKAYLVQLSVLYLLAVKLGRLHGKLSVKDEAELCNDMLGIPDRIQKAIDGDDQVLQCAQKLQNAQHVFFIGRGVDYTLCMESSLKLKEVSYIHCEAYAAGELKHGTISLIENGTPVIAVATQPTLYAKTVSNLEEVKSRGADVMLVCNEGDKVDENLTTNLLRVPKVRDILSPMVTIVPLQLLAYHIAVLRGCDVDKPRNLAKSVTVE
ncbi:MAG: glutamine--fructose-6-phosphate transaminase (isomerizing) [Oscillospiraceae bacterium]|nr:glutamine--fructose-6-phosphate transaminase (isomerizing) [Oscillospiraceae bacterium]